MQSGLDAALHTLVHTHARTRTCTDIHAGTHSHTRTCTHTQQPLPPAHSDALPPRPHGQRPPRVITALSSSLVISAT